MTSDYRVAIDIGTTKVCTIVTRQRADHRTELAGIGIVPCNGMSKGAVQDSSTVTEAVRKSVAIASEKAGVEIRSAYVGLTGNHVESKNRWANVPRDGGMRAVTDEDINAAQRAAGQIELGTDRKLLHVIPRSYALDGLHGVRNPIGMHTGELHVESHIITGAVGMITDLHNAVSDAGIRVSAMVVQHLASADAVLTADERDFGAVLVDVGGGTSDIAVYNDGAVVHTAVLPVGGYQFSNDLSIAFGIDFSDAEKLKLEHGTAAPELAGLKDEVNIQPTSMAYPIAVTKREIGQVLKERAAELFRMIDLKIDVPHLLDVPLDRIVFTGGGAKLEGFLNIAKYVMQKNVRLATPRGLDGMPEGTNDPSYSAAVGIALWSLKNLPAENQVDVRKSTPSPSKPAGALNGSESSTSALSALKGWLARRASSDKSQQKETAGL